MLEEVAKEELDAIENEYIEKEIESMNAHDIVLSDSLNMFLQEMKKYPLLTAEREMSLVKICKSGLLEERKIAKEVLISSNLRLVVYNAKKYNYNQNISLEDLIQEGIIGLVKGIENFDYKLGYKLSTYATFWIRQAIIRYINNNGRLIRLPVYMHEKIDKYNKAKKEYMDNYGKEPNNKIMAKILNANENDIEKLMEYSTDIVSLDKNIADDEDVTLGEIIADENAILPEEYLGQVMLREDIDKALSILKKRERNIICMRYGLDDNEVQTLEAIAKKLNITRERVRQIENIALRKLKYHAKNLVDILR